jgi:hypothetical protein
VVVRSEDNLYLLVTSGFGRRPPYCYSLNARRSDLGDYLSVAATGKQNDEHQRLQMAVRVEEAETVEQQYRLFGVRPGASPQDVREVYNDLIEAWRADRSTRIPEYKREQYRRTQCRVIGLNKKSSVKRR